MKSLASQFQNLGLADDKTTGDNSTVTWDFKIAATPLQCLKNGICITDNERKNLLHLAVNADKKADELYEALCDRTTQLAQEVVTVDFAWRLRVAGFRGFQELLLPAFHPVYGIPYIPASSLKGVLRTWALKTLPSSEHQDAERLLGYLKGEQASLAAVQILDAFPTQHCLSLDIANSQWHWDSSSNHLKYAPVPHIMLSLLRPKFKIGLQKTCTGNSEDVSICRRWLEQALQSEGVGGRTSTGYGRIKRIHKPSKKPLPALLNPRYARSEHPFELWTEGVHGNNTEDHEMRPVALRGILRYWFRAVTLGLYTPNIAKQLESEFFGSIDSKEPIEGYLRLSFKLDKPSQKVNYQSLFYEEGYEEGRIVLESKNNRALEVAQQLLKLATHLGSIGKGARRPLHWNKPRLRGGYLQLLNEADILKCDADDWQSLFKALKTNLESFHRVTASPPALLPGTPNNRLHDVINTNTAIYLLPQKKLKHPKNVNRWEQEGNKSKVRGSALEFFYKPEYKGVNRQQEGNELVGGKLGTPSFVWITSNCLHRPDKAYQAITIFGTDNVERAGFIQALSREFKGKGLIRVDFT